ncbi:MAG: MOSC domain-containing protein [Rhodothermales bacterium]|nr:MOSC domain-containing protein [Rhodothermales bacterium]
MDINPLDEKRHSTVIGSVVSLLRYPVKSMGAQELDEVQLTWHGFEGDRRWAFVRDGVERSGFPWLTIREKPDMWKYVPRFVRPDNPNSSPVTVATPEGRDFDLLDPALAAELGHGARIIKQDRGVFDTFPLSLITTQTITMLGSSMGRELRALRFRPNLLIKAAGAAHFPEDAWVGAVLKVGDAAFRVDKRDQRCAVVNIDPETTRSDPSILKAISRERGSCLGVYGSTVKPGRITVGDQVFLHT